MEEYEREHRHDNPDKDIADDHARDHGHDHDRHYIAHIETGSESVHH